MAQVSETFTSELEVDASGAEAGVRAYETAIGRAAVASGKLGKAGAAATATIEQTTAAQRVALKQTEAAERALARYVDRFDPAIKAQRELERAETAVAQARRRGIEVTEQQMKTVEGLRQKADALRGVRSGEAAATLAAAKAMEQAAAARIAAWDAEVREREADAAMIIAHERSMAEEARKAAAVEQAAAQQRISAWDAMVRDREADAAMIISYERDMARAAEMAAAEAANAERAAAQQRIAAWDAVVREREADAQMILAAEREMAQAAEREARALAELQGRARALSESLDPAARAQRIFAEQTAEADELLARGLITYDQHTIAVRRYRDAMEATAKTGEPVARGTKLAAHEMINLSHQVQDFFVQVTSGHSPFVALAQQGPQAAMAVGGYRQALSMLMTPTAAVVAGVVTLGAAGAVVVSRLVEISGETRRLSTTLETLNPNLNVTAELLRGIAFETAEERGTSRAEAMEALTQVIRNTRIQSVGLAEDITKASVDISAVMGGTVAEWAGKLSDAAKTGSVGFAELAGQLPGITADTLAAARAAERQGDRLKAIGLIVDELDRKFSGAAKSMKSEWDKATDDLWQAWDKFLERWANDPRAQWFVRGSSGALVEMLSWVTPDSEAENRAQEMARVLELLTHKQAQLREAVEGGAAGDGLVRLREQVTDLQQQYYALAAAGTAAAKATAGVGGAANSNSPVGQTPLISEADKNRLKVNEEALDRYAAALRNVGPARQIAVAGIEVYNAALERSGNEALAQEEKAQAEARARLELSVALGDQTRELGLQTAAQERLAEAAGLGEAAMRRATIENQVAAAALQGLETATRSQLEAQEQLARAQIHNEFAGSIEREIQANERLTAAVKAGGMAVRDAEIVNAAYAQTLREIPYPQTAAGLEEWNKRLIENVGLIQKQVKSQSELASSRMLRDQEDQLALGRKQLDLMWESAEAREVELARTEALIALRDQNIDAASKEGEAYLKNAEALARQGLGIERASAAYQELEQFGDRALDALIEKMTQAGDSALSWGDALQALGAEFQTLALRMAAINPLKNAAFGTNLPTIYDLAGSVGGEGGDAGGAANQNVSGSLAALANYSGSGIFSRANIDAFGANYLGMAPVNSQFVGPMPAGSAAPGMTLSSVASTAMTAIGYAAASSAISGMGASLLGGNAQVASAVGAVSGPLPGIIAGMIFKEKPSVGPNYSYHVGNDGYAYNPMVDNGYDPEQARQQGNAMADNVAAISYLLGGQGRPGFGVSWSKNGYQLSNVNGVAGVQGVYKDMAALLRGAFSAPGGLVGGDAEMRAVMSRSKANDAEDLIGDLQFAQGVLDLNRGLTQTDVAIRDLNKTYGEQIRKAQELGLETGKLAQQRDKEISRLQEQRRMSMMEIEYGLAARVWQGQGDPAAAAHAELLMFDFSAMQQRISLRDQLDALGELTTSYGVDMMSRLEAALAQERAAVVKAGNDLVLQAEREAAAQRAQQMAVAEQSALATITGISQYVRSISVGEMSALAPEQQFGLARSQFNAVSGAALAGDYSSLQQVTGYADSLLRAARQQYGSGQGYADAFRQVTDVLSRLATVDPGTLTERAFVSETRSQTQTLVTELQNLRREVEMLRREAQQSGNAPARAA